MGLKTWPNVGFPFAAPHSPVPGLAQPTLGAPLKKSIPAYCDSLVL
jgi:hypothetical protein